MTVHCVYHYIYTGLYVTGTENDQLWE